MDYVTSRAHDLFGGMRRARVAIALYTRACDDLALACDTLGDLLAKGLGVPADLCARRPSTGAGVTPATCACGHAAHLYREGGGVARDQARALALYERGCDSGTDLTCDDLGDVYAKGPGMKPDRAKAAEYYKRACDGGFALACEHLASVK